MAHAFPLESVDMYVQSTTRFQEAHPQVNKYVYARGAMERFNNGTYSFMYLLQSGHYSPWPHEYQKLMLSGLNCTTVIPKLYLYLESFGITPEIVQFIGFQRIRKQKDAQDPKGESHFALMIDVGHQHKYLIDPFWRTFGPILSHTKKSLRIGKRGEFLAETRKYDQLLRYSPEEFATMMDRLHDPAQSLDVLVAGQKIFQDRLLAHAESDLMVYYDAQKNAITTRLYIDQVGFPDKVVHHRMQCDDLGDIVASTLQLSTAKEAYWKTLKDEKVIARTDYKCLRRLRQELGRVSHKGFRLGPELLKKKNQPSRDTVLELVEECWNSITPREQKAIYGAVLTRTLYETTHPRQQYVHSERERNAKWRKVLRQFYHLYDDIEPLHQRLYRDTMKLEVLPPRAKEKMKRRKNQLEGQKEKIGKKETELHNLHQQNKAVYHRNQDKHVFAQRMAHFKIARLEQRVARLEVDFRLGYLAIVADYLPYIFDTFSSLELNFAKETLKEKIAARHSQP